MKLQKFFSPFSWTEFDTLLHTLTNDHNFDVDTVSFGGQFCFQTFLSQTIKSLSLAHSEFFCKKPFFNVMMCYYLGGITHNFSLDFVKYKESPQIEILNQIFFVSVSCMYCIDWDISLCKCWYRVNPQIEWQHEFALCTIKR